MFIRIPPAYIWTKYGFELYLKVLSNLDPIYSNNILYTIETVFYILYYWTIHCILYTVLLNYILYFINCIIELYTVLYTVLLNYIVYFIFCIIYCILYTVLLNYILYRPSYIHRRASTIWRVFNRIIFGKYELDIMGLKLIIFVCGFSKKVNFMFLASETIGKLWEIFKILLSIRLQFQFSTIVNQEYTSYH